MTRVIGWSHQSRRSGGRGGQRFSYCGWLRITPHRCQRVVETTEMLCNASGRRSRAAEIASHRGYPVAREISRAVHFYDSCREKQALHAKTGIQYRRFYSAPPQQLGRVVGGALNSRSRCLIAHTMHGRMWTTSWSRPTVKRRRYGDELWAIRDTQSNSRTTRANKVRQTRSAAARQRHARIKAASALPKRRRHPWWTTRDWTQWTRTSPSERRSHIWRQSGASS